MVLSLLNPCIDRALVSHYGKNDIQINPIEFLDSRIIGSGNILLHRKPDNIVVTQKGLGKVVDVLPDAPLLYDINAYRLHPFSGPKIKEITV